MKHRTFFIVMSLLLVPLLAGCGIEEDLVEERTVSSAPPYNIGNDTQFAGNASVTDNWLLGIGPFTVANATNVVSLGIIVDSVAWGAVNGRMGLYTDAAGTPAQRVTYSAEQPFVVGVNDLPVPVTAIAPGDYWISAWYNPNILGIAADNGSTTPLVGGALTYHPTDPFPDPYFPNAIIATVETLNYYMTVRD